MNKTVSPDSNVIPFPKQPDRGFELYISETKPDPVHGGLRSPLSSMWEWFVAIVIACFAVFGF